MAVTQYTDPYPTDGTAGYRTKDVSAQGITDIANNNALFVMLIWEPDMEADSEQLFNPSTSGAFVNTDGVRVALSESTSTTKDPKLAVQYTDGTSQDIYAASLGNWDDAWMRTDANTSEADLLAARNEEDANYISDSGALATLGNYKVFSSVYLTRLIFRFTPNPAKVVSSATLSLHFAAIYISIMTFNFTSS